MPYHVVSHVVGVIKVTLQYDLLYCFTLFFCYAILCKQLVGSGLRSFEMLDFMGFADLEFRHGA